jgi:hypothetical protein
VIPAWARTVLIVAGLAAIVAFVPHGGSSAGFVAALITIALTVLFVLFAGRLYQMFNTDIYGLGERHRAILYASLGAFVLAMAGRVKLLNTGAGVLLWIVLIAGALAGVVSCFVRWRADRV